MSSTDTTRPKRKGRYRSPACGAERGGERKERREERGEGEERGRERRRGEEEKREKEKERRKEKRECEREWKEGVKLISYMKECSCMFSSWKSEGVEEHTC